MECPVCSQGMQAKAVDDVKVDVCEEHGVWLDKGEIEALLESTKKKGQNEGLAKQLWTTMGEY